MVGADSPLVAIEDALRRYGADELIISTHTPERSHWLEAGVVQRAREQLDIPVTHVVVDVARQRVKVAV
jgi:GABA permease